MRALIIVTMLIAGCAYRQEVREQHCAQICIDKLGVHRQTGVYGSWAESNRCYCRPWEGPTVFAGRLNDKWRPE